MKATIALIRCGMTAGGEADKLVGITDEPLSPAGREAVLRQAQAGGYPAASLVYTGEAERCGQTALLVYPRTPAVILRELRPFDYGVFTGRTLAELEGDPEFQAWARSESAPPCPGGDSPYTHSARSTRAFLGIVQEMETKQLEQAAIITHQTVISAIMSRFCVPRSAYRDWETDWGRGYLIQHDSRLSLTKMLSEL